GDPVSVGWSRNCSTSSFFRCKATPIVPPFYLTFVTNTADHQCKARARTRWFGTGRFDHRADRSGDLQVATALRSSPQSRSGEFRSPWRPEGRRYENPVQGAAREVVLGGAGPPRTRAYDHDRPLRTATATTSPAGSSSIASLLDFPDKALSGQALP